MGQMAYKYLLTGMILQVRNLFLTSFTWVKTTPRKTNMEHHGTQKWRFGRWFSFSNMWFSGSMLVFGGVLADIPLVFFGVCSFLLGGGFHAKKDRNSKKSRQRHIEKSPVQMPSPGYLTAISIAIWREHGFSSSKHLMQIQEVPISRTMQIS